MSDTEVAHALIRRFEDRWMITRRPDGVLVWGGEFHADEGPPLTDAELAYMRDVTGENHYENWEP